MEAKDVKKLSRKVIRLPILGLRIEVRAYRTRDMLASGLLPVIQYDGKTSESEETAKRIIKQAGEVLCVCSVEPKVIPQDNAKDGEVSLQDIPQDDVVYAFQHIIKLSQSRFYGVNRRAFDPYKDAELLEGQKKVALIIDMIATRYSLSPLEIERWSDEELARVLAIIEVSEAERAKAKQDA